MPLFIKSFHFNMYKNDLKYFTVKVSAGQAAYVERETVLTFQLNDTSSEPEKCENGHALNCNRGEGLR